MTFEECLSKIKTAVYGKDVRTAIHDALDYLKNNMSGTYTLPAATADTLGGVKLSDVVSATFDANKHKLDFLYVDLEGNVVPVPLLNSKFQLRTDDDGNLDGLDFTASGNLWLMQLISATCLENDESTDRFNVKTFGAVGDGETDDSKSIQTAFDACNSKGGGTVFFPKGVYMIGNALGNEKYVEFYSNMHIVGEPGTVLRFHSSIKDIISDSGNDTMVQPISLLRNHTTSDKGAYACTENVIIENITFDCNKDFAKKATVLGVGHAQNIIIKYCNFVNGKSSDRDHLHYIEINACKDIKIIDCSFCKSLSTSSSGTSEMINIDPADSLSYGYETYYMYDNTKCDNIEIVRCKFISYKQSDIPSGYHVSAAIGSHITSTLNALNIHDCYFEGDWYAAGVSRNWVIRFYGAQTNCRVYNNLFVAASPDLSKKPIGVCLRCSEESNYVYNNTFINYDSSNLIDLNESVLKGYNNMCFTDGAASLI